MPSQALIACIDRRLSELERIEAEKARLRHEWLELDMKQQVVIQHLYELRAQYELEKISWGARRVDVL